LLVILVVFFFLGNLPAAFIPSISVPVSLIGTLAAMYLPGYSLDNLPLMALIIATGFVVDDAIVVIENISRHIEDGMQLVAAPHAPRASRSHYGKDVRLDPLDLCFGARYGAEERHADHAWWPAPAGAALAVIRRNCGRNSNRSAGGRPMRNINTHCGRRTLPRWRSGAREFWRGSSNSMRLRT
jgi:hypothetical protein